MSSSLLTYTRSNQHMQIELFLSGHSSMSITATHTGNRNHTSGGAHISPIHKKLHVLQQRELKKTVFSHPVVVKLHK